MSLVVSIQTVNQLIRASKLSVREPNTLEDMGFPIADRQYYYTDGIIYPEDISRTKYEIVELIVEDRVVKLAKGSNEVYAHIDWLTPKVTIEDDYLLVGEDTYRFSLEKLNIVLCPTCGSRVEALYKEGKCTTCFTSEYTRLNGYSFKPTPIFKGEQLKSDKNNPVWYGIELEHSIDKPVTMADFIHKYGDSVYLKNDSSIMGSNLSCEMVSHPHSFQELMKEDSWVNSLNTLKTISDTRQFDTNGCHIHISNTAFIDDANYSKWYFFVYSLANGILQKIGQRELTSYCKNIKYDTLLSKTIVKSDISNLDRGVVINEKNKHTKEVRVFSTTTEPKTLKRYIQFLESTLKYSKYAKKTLNYDDYFNYVMKYAEKYRELLECITGLTEITKPEPIIFPTKRIFVDTWNEVPSKYYANIISLKVVSTWVTVSNLLIDTSNGRFTYNGRGNWYALSEITGVEYAK